MDYDMVVHVWDIRHLQTTKDPRRKDGFVEIHFIGPVLEARGAYRMSQHGAEIKSDSLQKRWMSILDGDQPRDEQIRN